MPLSVSHQLSATTPDDPAYEIRPSHWNQSHAFTLNAAGSEISGAFSNAGNVSFALETNGRITASANVTAAPSPVNVTGANGSSVNAQTIAFSNSNGLTLGVSTAANGATITGSHNGLTQQSTQPVAASAANGSVAFSTLSFSNANGISFSTAAGPAIVASHNGLTTAAQSNQVVNSLNGSTGQMSLAVGSSLSSSTNGSTITFGLASNITTALQSAGNYLTTARASNDAIGLNTAQSNVTWTVNSSGLSLDARGYAGTGTTFNGANISGSITHNSAGINLSLSVAPGGGGADGVNIIAAGTRTATTNGTVLFSNANGLTFGLDAVNGSVVTGSYTVPTVTNSSWTVSDANTSATVGRLAFTNANGLTLSLSTSNNGNHTVIGSYTVPTVPTSYVSNVNGSSGALSLAVGSSLSSSTNGSSITFGLASNITTALQSTGNYLTTARASNDAIGLNTAQTNVTWTVNSSGLSFNAAGYAGTATGFTGANISGSMTHNSVGLSLSLSVAAPGAAAENNNHNLLGANTAGNTTASGSTIGLSGINLTLSGTNNSVINISAPATSSLVGSSGLSISTNGSTISAYPVARSEWNNIAALAQAASLQANSIVSLQPFMVEWPLVFSNAFVGMSINPASAANASSAYIDMSVSGVIYSRNASSLSSVASFSQTHTISWSSNGTATAGGMRAITATLPGATLTPGNYWLAVHVSTTNSATGGANTTALGNSISMALGYAASSIGAFGLWNGNTNATLGIVSGLGAISTGATLASIPFSSITVTGTRMSNAPVAFGLRNDTYQ